MLLRMYDDANTLQTDAVSFVDIKCLFDLFWSVWFIAQLAELIV